MSNAKIHSFVAEIRNVAILIDVEIQGFFSIRQTAVKSGRQIYSHCLFETRNVFQKRFKMQLDCCIVKTMKASVGSLCPFFNDSDYL